MNKKLSRIYLLATFTVALFSTQNLLAESIVLFSRDFTDGSLSPFTPEGNWQISNYYGQPLPGAQYNWSPTQTDYSHSLTSPVLDGSSVNDSVAFTYDLYLNNYSTATLEEFAVEIKIDTTWITIATYDNSADTIAWGSHVHYVSEYFPTSEEVKIRFRAHGPNSYNINYWVIDNIKLEGIQDSTPPDTPTNLSASPDDEQVTLAWSPNTENDLALYRIYRGSSSPASTLIDSVTANSDQDTSYVDLNVSNGELYYYRITALDLTGNESDYSDEISITPYDPEIGQAIELLTNNSESTVGNYDAGYPINTYYHDHRHQSLYLASELTDAGIAPGASINGIQLK
ncbi:MAG TPA: fibronectin type III domain-containing protein, partial [Candidatus Marinimicrobia bacterium]|nr:fibronectin type III domain-containing protein [Candidatus Neomarinimicrobiota bacterium]